MTARLLPAACFAVAGAAKLFDRPGSRQALRGFGVPARLATPGAIVLPLLELGIAVALLLPGATRWGAIAAAGLLLAFGRIASPVAAGADAVFDLIGHPQRAAAGAPEGMPT